MTGGAEEGARLWIDIWLTLAHSPCPLERPLHPQEGSLSRPSNGANSQSPARLSLLLRKSLWPMLAASSQVSLLLQAQHHHHPHPRPLPGTLHLALPCPSVLRYRESPQVGLLRCRGGAPACWETASRRFFLLRGRCLLLLQEKKVGPGRKCEEEAWVAI